ncbi:unnamed protein product [Heligmosomoides polygyrus]|uniref:Secreted protein n=1 Tax=Heligmosomoides polygyrus TaxID=6339 RepID=A0A183FP54_HELPZ|nr:unnamed protein product [Heligmosomoides polygyrus]
MTTKRLLKRVALLCTMLATGASPSCKAVCEGEFCSVDSLPELNNGNSKTSSMRVVFVSDLDRNWLMWRFHR